MTIRRPKPRIWKRCLYWFCTIGTLSLGFDTWEEAVECANAPEYWWNDSRFVDGEKLLEKK